MNGSEETFAQVDVYFIGLPKLEFRGQDARRIVERIEKALENGEQLIVMYSSVKYGQVTLNMNYFVAMEKHYAI